jgi:hypothetical protein
VHACNSKVAATDTAAAAAAWLVHFSFLSRTRSVQSAAAKRQLLCREAFHYKEHPANKAVAALLQVICSPPSES